MIAAAAVPTSVAEIGRGSTATAESAMPYPAVKPPSTTSSAPVMNEDSSLARKSAT